jgi:hypothetical protein
MPIRKLQAEAAIKALIACNAAEMFDKIRANQHSMEKHFSKGTAHAAAVSTGYPQGYFKRQKGVIFITSEDLQRPGLSAKTYEKALAAVGAKKKADFGRKLGRRQITVMEKSPASKDDILGLVDAVISSDACELRESHVDAMARFLAVAPIPRGFYGRSIDDEGEKARDCDKAVLVINALSTSNPQIVTIFPANDQYANACPLLT